MSHLLKNQIKANLESVEKVAIDDASLTRAAVVVAISTSPVDPSSHFFLLTRRATKMRQHAGQFALPGGKLDAGEGAVQAALRELEEEVGIVSDHASVLGLLDDYPTRSGFCITPVVVWLDADSQIVPNPDEVAEIFHIPLAELEREDLVNLDEGQSPDSPIFSINLKTVGHEIYAPTAAIIYQFYELAIKRNESRVAFYDEPGFAWK